MNTPEVKPLVSHQAMKPLSPAFFDDLPLQYSDDAHRRRHLPYGARLQPPLRDPLKEPVAALSGEGVQRVNGVFTFPAAGLPVPAIARDCNSPGNSVDRQTQQHCCIRTFGSYEICQHRSLQKKHMQVKPYREVDKGNHDTLSHTSLTKESREYMLQPRCLQKRCDKYLEFEREAQLEGMCSKCKASGLTATKIREWGHQEPMQYLKKTLERLQEDRQVQGSNIQPPNMSSVKDIKGVNEQKDQKLARSLGHRRQRSIFVPPWPYSPTSDSVHNALPSFNPALKQHTGLHQNALPYTNWRPEILTAERGRFTDLSLGAWAIPARRGSGESTANSAHSTLRLKLKPGSNQCEVISNEFETPHGLNPSSSSESLRYPPNSTYESDT